VPPATGGHHLLTTPSSERLCTTRGPIVLVGHSYGGAVITNAAVNPNVKALVFVDAFIPDQGESVIQLASAQPGSCLGGGGDPTKVFNFVPYPGAPPGGLRLVPQAGGGRPLSRVRSVLRERPAHA